MNGNLVMPAYNTALKVDRKITGGLVKTLGTTLLNDYEGRKEAW